MPEVEIGKISHYFDRIQVAAIVLTGKLAVGDTIRVKGHTTDVTTTIESMQIEHDAVKEAGPGDNVGIRVPDRVREHDVVFKVGEGD